MLRACEQPRLGEHHLASLSVPLHLCVSLGICLAEHAGNLNQEPHGPVFISAACIMRRSGELSGFLVTLRSNRHQASKRIKGLLSSRGPLVPCLSGG